MKILIAEDDQTIRQMMVTLLVRCGFVCDAVDDGRTAVEAWERDGYDFIFMDVQMPVLDGLAAARIIREKEAICYPSCSEFQRKLLAVSIREG